MIIVQSIVKAHVHNADKRISKDALVALDKRVVAILNQAIAICPKHIKTISVTDIAQARDY